jgi:sporulation protein YlmC with PRC-barrel domain
MTTDRNMDNVNDLDADETSQLISSSKVEGTTVYNHAGENLGSIDSLMLNKQSGQAEYAVMEFGGFLGMGADRYPIPWQQLSYDTEQDGYVVDLDREMLEKAPRYGAADNPNFDAQYGREVSNYYDSYQPN